MSFLWYWPLPKDLSGFWDFDKWKQKQTWKPIKSEQSGTHELVAAIEQGASQEQWEKKRGEWQRISDEILGQVSDTKPAKVRVEFLGDPLDRATYSIRRLRYTLTDAPEWGYAFVLAPSGERKKRPAVIALHQTSPAGKVEVIGLERTADLNNGVWYGQELAEQGFVV